VIFSQRKSAKRQRHVQEGHPGFSSFRNDRIWYDRWTFAGGLSPVAYRIMPSARAAFNDTHWRRCRATYSAIIFMADRS
jgi:hypothetical protein